MAGIPAEVVALGLLLDRTYAEAARAARDPRHLDRGRLIGLFDLWDNHLFPAVAAATRTTRWAKRSAARAVLASMGAWSSERRRDWIAEQLASTGLAPDACLGAPSPPWAPYLNHAGHLRPVPQPLTPAAADLVNADYDLDGGHVERALIELGPGAVPELHATLVLSARHRRYTTDLPTTGDDPRSRPQLSFSTAKVESYTFATVDRGRASLVGQPTVTVTDEHSTVSAATPGGQTILTARELEYRPDDIFWHQSAAAAATTLGPIRPRLDWPKSSRLSGQLGHLALLQHAIMLRLRTMRYPHLLRRRELQEAGALGAGLGSATIAAAARRSERARERAADQLLNRLATHNGDAQAFLATALKPMHVPLLATPTTTLPAAVPVTRSVAHRLLADLDFTNGRLRYLNIRAEHRPGHADQITIHLDARHTAQGRDTIVVIVMDDPHGRTALHATPHGLTITAQPRIEFPDDHVSLTIPLANGPWTVHAATATWYTD